MHPLSPLDYDGMTAHVDAVLPDDSLALLSRVTSGTSRNGDPYQAGRLTPDVTVVKSPLRTTISGSPHKYALGESVGVCGPSEIHAFAEDVAGRLGLPLDAVLNGRVSRFDLGVNLHVDHDVCELLRLVSAPPQMEEFLFRTGTKTFKNSVREITLYDKVGKLLDKRKGDLVPDDWTPGRILRVEVRFGNIGKEFGRTVTVGDLCTPAFYEEASARWLKLVLGVRVRDGVWVAPRGGRTVRDLRDGYAEAGLVLTGGNAAASERINASRRAGDITSAQATRQRKWVGNVTRAVVNVEIDGDTAVIENTIASSFKNAVDAAAAMRPPCVRASA